MRYIHCMRHWPDQNFHPMSHLISPCCQQPDCVHVGKTMIVITLFWLALRTEGGVLFLDLFGKGSTPQPSTGDRGSPWWAPALVIVHFVIVFISYKYNRKEISIELPKLPVLLVFSRLQVNRFTKCGVCTMIKEHIHKLKGKARRMTWIEKKAIHLQQQA